MEKIIRVCEGFEVKEGSCKTLQINRVTLKDLGLSLGRFKAPDSESEQQKYYDTCNLQFSLRENELYEVLFNAKEVKIKEIYPKVYEVTIDRIVLTIDKTI